MLRRLCDVAVQNYPAGLLLLTAACLHADQNLAAPNLSIIAEEFGLSALEKDEKLGGRVQLGFFLVGGATSLFVGPLADRCDRIRLLFWVVVTGAVPCLLIYQVPSGRAGWPWFMASRVITGISVGGSFPVLYSLSGDLCSPAYRAMIAALLGIATAGGVLIGQLLAGFLGSRLDWRAPFIAVAVPAVLTASLLRLTVKEPQAWRRLGGTRSGEPTEDVELESVVPDAMPTIEGRQDDDSKELLGTSGSIQDAEEAPAGGRRRAIAPEAPPSPGPEALGASQSMSEGRCCETKATQRRRTPPRGGAVPVRGRCSRWAPCIAEACRGAIDEVQGFRVAFEGQTNRFVFAQSLPACVSWSTVTTFLPDYLHAEQGLEVEAATMLVASFGLSCLFWAFFGAGLGTRVYNQHKGNLAYVMSFALVIPIIPFTLLINADPALLHGGLSTLPSHRALLLAVVGGVAAVANPNIKGLLMNTNPPHLRGRIFALVTLSDDVGKGLGPAIVALGVRTFGRRQALTCAMSCWGLCALILLPTRYTIARDARAVEEGRLQAI